MMKKVWNALLVAVLVIAMACSAYADGFAGDTDIAATGDAARSQMYLWITLLAVSAVVLIALAIVAVVRHKRKKK